MSEIRALLFDMDGVVIDSNPLHRDAWTEYNRRHGVETTPEMSRRISGKRNDEVVRDFFGDHLTHQEVLNHGRQKEALYRSLMESRLETAMVPGILEFLSRHQNLKTALVTNAEPANVRFVLEGSGLSRYFPVIVTGEDVVRPKPYPDIYLRAAKILDTAPADCVVFEDSPTGVAAALAAGMKVVGISTTDQQLEGASVMAADFLDPALERWISAPRRK